MPVKHYKVGTGSTALEYVRISRPHGEEEIEEFRRLLEGGAVDRLSELDQFCRRLLREGDFPDDLRRVLWSGPGEWREVPDDWEPDEASGETLMSVSAATRDNRFVGSDSPEGYAARVLRALEMVNTAKSSGNLDATALWAAKAGALAAEAEAKDLMDLGKLFDDGRRKRRRDPLAKLVDHILDTAPEATPKYVLHRINSLWTRRIDHARCVDEAEVSRNLTESVVVWRNNKGVEVTTSYENLSRRVQRLKILRLR